MVTGLKSKRERVTRVFQVSMSSCSMFSVANCMISTFLCLGVSSENIFWYLWIVGRDISAFSAVSPWFPHTVASMNFLSFSVSTFPCVFRSSSGISEIVCSPLKYFLGFDV